MSSWAREVSGAFEKRTSEVEIYHDTTFCFTISLPHSLQLIVTKTIESSYLRPWICRFWARLKLILSWATKLELREKGQNLFTPKTIKCITIITTLENIHKIETEKKYTKTIWTVARAITSWIAFIYPQWKYTVHQAKLTINYKVLPFEFSTNVKTWKESSIGLICKCWN